MPQELWYCIGIAGVKLDIEYSEPGRTVGLRRFSFGDDASIVPLDLVLQYLTLLPMATM